jgi:energy-coupling factor transporter ATP-binding protein EcfA2
MKARSLKEVHLYFDPRESLKGEKLKTWFVQRASPREGLRISLSIQPEPQKMLLVGHRGSGKSTELNKLAEEIKDQFHVIIVDVLAIIGRTNLEYEDLMLAISTQVTRNCIENRFINRPLAEPVRQGLGRVFDWWQRVVAGIEFGQPAPEAEVSLQLDTLLGEIEVGARQSSSTRETLKEQINRQMPDLIRHLNWVIGQAQAGDNRRLLIIVEGSDKIDLDSAASIFRDHAPTITAPEADMIYTFPIDLRHSQHYNTISLNFSDVSYLPNLATRCADGTPNEAGIATLRDFVLARMEEHLIEPQALDLIVKANGGIPVTLISLMRTSSLIALLRNEAGTCITRDDANEAIRRLRREMSAGLTRDDWRVLRERHRDRHLTNDEIEQKLLYNGSLIDYANGETWCDAHPALWNLLEQDDDNANAGPTPAD